MKAEIIMIGTELLLGQIVDTNASYLARQLATLGIDVFRKTTVGDNERRIVNAVQKALSRCDVVITSGGIGPTVDDKTREAVAGATDQKLVLNPELLEYVSNFFKRRGLELGENNKRQAFIPENAIPIENPVGTAPGFIVEKDGSCVLSLPGVPRELYYLTEQTVLPFIKKKFDIQTIIKIRTLRTAGVGESNIDRMIDDLEASTNPTVGLAAHPGSVDIRVSAKAENEKTAIRMLDDMEQKVRSRVGDIIFGIDKDTIEQVVADLLRDQNLSLSILETNTGGVFTARFTETADGFHILNRSQTTSVQRAVEALLPDNGIAPVASAALSERLASILRTDRETDIGMAIVGDEDPDVGPFKKIPGNTFIGLSKEGIEQSRQMQLGGITNDARIRITSFAFEVLRRFLLDY